MWSYSEKLGLPICAKDSVIAIDTVHSAEENSMDTVEYHPCDVDGVNKPSSALRSGVMSDTMDLNYSNQAQQSSFAQPAAETGSNAREVGGSSMNGGGGGGGGRPQSPKNPRIRGR
jgi:hypothetical protein